MNLKLFTFLLFFGLTAHDVFSQIKIKRYDAVVRTVSGRRFKGVLETVDDKGLTIRFHKVSKLISADSIKTIRIKRYNAQNRNLLAGGLLGLASGLTIYKLESDKGNLQPINLPVILVSSTLTGAAIFGTINSITSVEKYKNVNQQGYYQQIKDSIKQYSLSR
jgi:hypothetical protein